MILPTKRIPEEKCLLRLGGEILTFLEEPKTVSRLWNQLKQRRKKKGQDDTVTFDWFNLALSMLFAVNLIKLSDGLIQKEIP